MDGFARNVDLLGQLTTTPAQAADLLQASLTALNGGVQASADVIRALLTAARARVDAKASVPFVGLRATALAVVVALARTQWEAMTPIDHRCVVATMLKVLEEAARLPEGALKQHADKSFYQAALVALAKSDLAGLRGAFTSHEEPLLYERVMGVLERQQNSTSMRRQITYTILKFAEYWGPAVYRPRYKKWLAQVLHHVQVRGTYKGTASDGKEVNNVLPRLGAACAACFPGGMPADAVRFAAQQMVMPPADSVEALSFSLALLAQLVRCSGRDAVLLFEGADGERARDIRALGMGHADDALRTSAWELWAEVMRRSAPCCSEPKVLELLLSPLSAPSPRSAAMLRLKCVIALWENLDVVSNVVFESFHALLYQMAADPQLAEHVWVHLYGRCVSRQPVRVERTHVARFHATWSKVVALLCKAQCSSVAASGGASSSSSAGGPLSHCCDRITEWWMDALRQLLEDPGVDEAVKLNALQGWIATKRRGLMGVAAHLAERASDSRPAVWAALHRLAYLTCQLPLWRFAGPTSQQQHDTLFGHDEPLCWHLRVVEQLLACRLRADVDDPLDEAIVQRASGLLADGAPSVRSVEQLSLFLSHLSSLTEGARERHVLLRSKLFDSVATFVALPPEPPGAHEGLQLANVLAHGTGLVVRLPRAVADGARVPLLVDHCRAFFVHWATLFDKLRARHALAFSRVASDALPFVKSLWQDAQRADAQQPAHFALLRPLFITIADGIICTVLPSLLATVDNRAPNVLEELSLPAAVDASSLRSSASLSGSLSFSGRPVDDANPTKRQGDLVQHVYELALFLHECRGDVLLHTLHTGWLPQVQSESAACAVLDALSGMMNQLLAEERTSSERTIEELKCLVLAMVALVSRCRVRALDKASTLWLVKAMCSERRAIQDAALECWNAHVDGKRGVDLELAGELLQQAWNQFPQRVRLPPDTSYNATFSSNGMSPTSGPSLSKRMRLDDEEEEEEEEHDNQGPGTSPQYDPTQVIDLPTTPTKTRVLSLPDESSGVGALLEWEAPKQHARALNDNEDLVRALVPLLAGDTRQLLLSELLRGMSAESKAQLLAESVLDDKRKQRKL